MAKFTGYSACSNPQAADVILLTSNVAGNSVTLHVTLDDLLNNTAANLTSNVITGTFVSTVNVTTNTISSNTVSDVNLVDFITMDAPSVPSNSIGQIWISSGTGTGADGDPVIRTTTSGGSTRTFNIADLVTPFSLPFANGHSVTGSDSTNTFDLAPSWDTTGTPTVLKVNVTDTASDAASLLMDLQVDTVSMFRVTKTGDIYVTGTDVHLNTGGTETITSGSGSVDVLTGSTSRIRLNSTGAISLGFAIGATVDNTGDVLLRRDDANILASRNSTVAQEYRIYNTFTDASNYERASFNWDTNIFVIDTAEAGTGVARGIQIGAASDATLGLFGATPVAQQATTGTTTGFTAGVGTATNDDSTFTGGTGTAAYTIGDIVLALKNLGVLAAS
jgi:hypothetical protein